MWHIASTPSPYYKQAQKQACLLVVVVSGPQASLVKWCPKAKTELQLERHRDNRLALTGVLRPKYWIHFPDRKALMDIGFAVALGFGLGA